MENKLKLRLITIGLFTSLSALTALSYYIAYRFGFDPWFQYPLVTFLNVILWGTILWIMIDVEKETNHDGE